MTNIVKKISGPYEISATNGNTVVNFGDSALSNAQVTVNGDLWVMGTEYIAHSLNLSVEAHEIILNANIGNITPTYDASIVVDRGNQPNVAVTWNETAKLWELTTDGTNFYEIATTHTGYLTVVQNDPNPSLGGNLNVNGHIITANTNVILAPTLNTQINSVVQLKELSTDPTPNIAGYNLVYAKLAAEGGSGLFVVNEAAQAEELITKRKAIVYSLIF